MSGRNPHDGEPYYCIQCGMGFGEFIVCELRDCELETQAEARRRIDDRERVLRAGRAS